MNSGEASRQPETIAAMIERSARLFEDTPVLLGEASVALTCQQLNNHLSHVVRTLNRTGIGRGDRVALVMPQGPDLAAAFLSIAAGAIASPLNPAYLESEFSFYLEDLRPRALVVLRGDESSSRRAAASLGIPVLEWIPLGADGGAGLDVPSDGSETQPLRSGFAEPADEALVLHTSGTTSRPKQVPLTQRNLLASAWHVISTLQLQPGDRCLNVMPLFHIHGLVSCLLAPLGSGGSSVCAPPFAADRMPAWLSRWQPKWYSGVPTMHQAFVAHLKQRSAPLEHSLYFVRSSAAALPPSVMAALEEVLRVPVIECSGMTEAAYQIASNRLPPGVRKPGSVGVAAGPRVAILGAEGEVAASGQMGEVAIQGPNVTAGYFNNPEANQSAFAGEWFRTGDQGFIDEDGYLFLTGRFKELINRGGEKIAPREIDETLLTHPAVRLAVAFGVPHPTLGEDIAAAVVLADNASSSEEDLRAFAFTKLPHFKVPSRIVIVEDIPKGPTGKLQRIGLAATLADALTVAHEEPTTDTERLVAKAFVELLNASRIGRHDNFFLLGGDSLRATQVVNRLQDTLALTVPIDTIFRFPTPAQLARHLDGVRDSDVDAIAADLERLSPEEQARLLNDLT